jgi:hypothetical protein
MNTLGDTPADRRSKAALFAKVITLITFPGFLAAAGFWLLRKGVFVSSDLMGENVVISHLHFSGALFGYVLVPLFFGFALMWGRRIGSLAMPTLANRKWGFLGAIAGAFQVFFMAWVDAPERAGRQLKLLSKQLDSSTMSTLRDLYASRVDEKIVLLESEIQAYTLVVLVALLLMYLCLFTGRKLSIHMCAATTVVVQAYIGMFHLYDRIPEEEHFVKSFGMPWGGWGSGWEFPLTAGFVVYGGILLGLIYWARRRERAHTHRELLLGLLLGVMVPIVGLLF